MKIFSQNIYEVIENNIKKHILIIYNMSPNHYVGLTIHNKNSNNLIHINSINKFVNINDLQEYNRNDIKGLVYVKGKFLKVNNEDFSYILKLLKDSLIKKLSNEINYNDIEKIKYLKWCYDKLLLNNNDIKISNLNSNSICWVDFGQNVGSEIRKLRPAILWRSSSDKKMWTVIPLSSKCYNDKYYFHYDLENLPHSTAKIEAMANFSYKRIREPFFYNRQIAHLSKNDYDKILITLKKYYLFDN